MPLRKKKIPMPDGRTLDGVSLPFQTGAEHWNEYLVDDGTVIRMKVVAVDIVRIDGEYDAEGNPIYVVQSTNVTSISAPDNLRRQ